MAQSQYDITIIGGGSGGLTAARAAAALGAKVLLIDKERIGGDCLNYGCVPSKSLIHVARVVQQAKETTNLGLTAANLKVDMAKVSTYIQDVIGRVSEAEQVYVTGVTVKMGKVAFQTPTKLRLNDEEITTRNTLIATGSHPAIPQAEGLAETGYLTNEDVFNLTSLPASILIVGGGPVGVELGQALHRLGCEVTILTASERILPKEDVEASTLLADILKSEAITLVTNARLTKAQRRGNKKVMTAIQGTQELTFAADELLLATGRQPNVAGLNLEAAGVQYNSKGITVNEYLQTTSANILAIGDVIGGYLFTHVAAYQAGIAARNMLLPISKKKVDYHAVPWCTFTDPEVAHIGLTAEEAQQQQKQIRIVKFPYADIDRAQAENATNGFIKLVLSGKKDNIVGAHMVGIHAGELLGELALAMQHKLTLNDLFNTIHAYPTISTGIQQTAFEAYLEGPQAASNRKVIQMLLKLRR